MEIPGHLTKPSSGSVTSLHVTLREQLGIPAVYSPYSQNIANSKDDRDL